MERVETLCNKLQEQIAQHASPDQLLVTVEMLQSELMHLKIIDPKKDIHSPVSVNIAPVHKESDPKEKEEASGEPAEKTVEVLQVDEAEMEAELEEIKRNAQAKNNLGAQHKPALLFDPIEDIPTLTHQQPLKEEKPTEVHHLVSKGSKDSLNDQLNRPKLELGDSLQEVPIKDLKKAIGINDKFLFINELFRGDDIMYERSIKTINSFAIYAEAEYWIKRELKLKLGWNDRNEVVKQFDQLIKRRFL